jgi:topoisomerase IV subunit A
MAKKSKPNVETKSLVHAPISEEPFSQALSQRYLTYALSTIMARSLPDVRDGLKPVHRRLLWAMRLLKLDPNTAYKKCARVVGDVIGKYHPHGDQSVYDAMVRLAQTFSVRYPLVDGQGNFGNIDGDNAAAMRYTEARLTEFATALMQGLDEDAVDFSTNYDGSEEEPDVFPGSFPNLLANGASGIAVGMATSIPPHNVAELADGLMLLVDQPNATVADLVQHIKGPDFPTGGIIVESAASMLQSYETGRGAFRLRARWEIEEQPRGGYLIVVTEIPYQVQKSKLIEVIASLINDKKLPILEDVRDESDENIRLVLEPKTRMVDANILMESLFKLTDLELRFSLNMNVLDKNRTPKVMSLKDVLNAWLEHQLEVLQRRSQHRLNKIDDRLELLGGYLIAYLNLDEVIRIIREEDEPKAELMKAFDLSDRQAEAILNMRLRSLRKLEEMEIRREEKNLRSERKNLAELLASDKKQRALVRDDLTKLKERYGKLTALGARRSSFADLPTVIDIPLEAMIEKEPITVICSEKGWIRAMKGHVPLTDEQKFKEGDAPRFAFHASTIDKLLLVADNGRFYTLAADKLPGGRGFGDPLRVMIDLDASANIVDLFAFQPGSKFLVASSDGKGFVVAGEQCLGVTKNGKQIMRPKDKDKLAVCRMISPTDDYIACVGDNRKLLVFRRDELPEMTGGQGVQLQKYKDGGLSDATAFTRAEGLSWAMGGDSGRTRTWPGAEMPEWIGSRAQAGRLPPAGFPKSNKFIAS